MDYGASFVYFSLPVPTFFLFWNKQSQLKKNKWEPDRLSYELDAVIWLLTFFNSVDTERLRFVMQFLYNWVNGENVSRLLTNLKIYPAFTRKCTKITSSPTVMVKLKICDMGKLVNSCDKFLPYYFTNPHSSTFWYNQGVRWCLFSGFPAPAQASSIWPWRGGVVCCWTGVRWSQAKFGAFRRTIGPLDLFSPLHYFWWPNLN